jgi:hypothetical protein
MAHGNVLSALAAARDLPQLSLVDALELTVLVARKDPRQASARRGTLALAPARGAARRDDRGALLAAASLVALTGGAYEEARATLRAMAERATSRRRARPVV